MIKEETQKVLGLRPHPDDLAIVLLIGNSRVRRPALQAKLQPFKKRKKEKKKKKTLKVSVMILPKFWD